MSSLDLNKSLTSSLSKVEYAITYIAKGLVSDIDDFNRGLTEASLVASSFSQSFRRASTEVDESSRRIQIAGDRLVGVFGLVTEGVNAVFGGWKNLGTNIDRVSEVNNQMIRLSGQSGEAVRDFKDEIMSIVSDLNKTTGGAYNPQDSYERIVSMSQGVTSNLEAIEEMSRPLLLTYESLDVNINNVAELFNRFYTRYTFSSSHMESIMDEIRGNTAGNSADAEATIRNIESLENWINYYAGNDNDLRNELLGKVSHYSSWLESMNLDSSAFTGYLNTAAYGDWSKNPELINILSRSGIGASQATDMARSGQYEELTQAIMDGIYDIMQNTKDSYALGQALDNYGIDRDLALEVWNTKNSNGYVGLDEFMQSLPNEEDISSSMEKIVEDKYVSAADKANNWLSQIYSKLANIQETLGFGISDIAGAFYLLSGLSGLGRGLFSGRGTAGSAGTGAGGILGTTGIVGALERGGLNVLGNPQHLATGSAVATGLATTAGVAAGVGLGAYGLYSGYQNFKEGETGYGTANMIGGGLGLVGAGALGASLLGVGAANVWNPVGWGSLIAGAAVIGITKAIESTDIGSSDAVERAYNEVAQSVQRQAKEHENALILIQNGLENNVELEKLRTDLINTGLLSEETAQSLLETKTEDLRGVLEEMTQSYREAVSAWSAETQALLNENKKEDIAYAAQLHGGLEELLQEWNDSGRLTKGSEELSAVENLMFELYQSLDARSANGEDFDKDTEKIYKTMTKAFKDGILSTKEANSIIDAGLFNTAFQNANFSPEELMRATSIMAATNSAGKGAYDLITRGLGEYHGNVENIPADVAARYGLSGYAEGSNYIERDQLALVHEGEAVVPKRFNPAVFTQEYLKEATKLLSENQSNIDKDICKSNDYLDESNNHMLEFISEMKEIKSYLREWKTYQVNRDRKLSTTQKLSYGSSSQIKAYSL